MGKAARSMISFADQIDRVIADMAASGSIIYVTLMSRAMRREQKQSREEQRQFWDVLKGVQPAPGIEERPSLVERLASLEKETTNTSQLNIGQNQTLERIVQDLGKLDKIDELTKALLNHLENHPPKMVAPRRRTPPTKQ